MNLRFPSDVLHLDTVAATDKRKRDPTDKLGSYTDAWGCQWQPGGHGEPIRLLDPPLADATLQANYSSPEELLDPARFTEANPICEATGRFTLVRSQAWPLDRLRQLCGMEPATSGLCSGNKELRRLLGKLHEFFRQEIELWSGTQVDGVVLGDDLGWVASSRAHLKAWRTLLKPLLHEYCEVLHRHDKFVFFLSEGTTGEAFDDLVEIGVDAVHAEWPHEEFAKHAARYRNRVTFWGGVERKKVEPPCQCDDIREAVFRVRKAVDYGAGGVISQIAWGGHIPLQSIATFFEQWLIALPVTC